MQKIRNTLSPHVRTETAGRPNSTVVELFNLDLRRWLIEAHDNQQPLAT